MRTVFKKGRERALETYMQASEFTKKKHKWDEIDSDIIGLRTMLQNSSDDAVRIIQTLELLEMQLQNCKISEHIDSVLDDLHTEVANLTRNFEDKLEAIHRNEYFSSLDERESRASWQKR